MNLDEYFEWMNPDEIKKFETRVLELALSKYLPILAICCGMWTVNYYYGGTLRFDESHQSFDGERIVISKWIHPVVATDLVKQKTYKVNTFHSKAIDSVGEGLSEFLVAEDDVVEGIYNLEKKIIGVQFHMENRGVSQSLTRQIMDIFENFQFNHPDNVSRYMKPINR